MLLPGEWITMGMLTGAVCEDMVIYWKRNYLLGGILDRCYGDYKECKLELWLTVVLCELDPKRTK